MIIEKSVFNYFCGSMFYKLFSSGMLLKCQKSMLRDNSLNNMFFSTCPKRILVNNMFFATSKSMQKEKSIMGMLFRKSAVMPLGIFIHGVFK
jgi:hypothetical protein